MTSRELKILNYLIILQLCSYKLNYVREIYSKYKNFLDRKIEDCFFEFDKKDQMIFKNLNKDVKLKALNCLEKYRNQIIFIEDLDFPNKLKEVQEYPIVLFYKGDLSLLKKVSISIVGTRQPSEQTMLNTEAISHYLMGKNLTIVSGLAKGVDVTSHAYCMKNNYNNLIAVIGTPVDKYYPIENRMVQQFIEKNGLVISEFPDFEPIQKWNFPRRNYIMSAISSATIVMQAGDTSGTVSQARSTLKNGRPLFVPANVFDDPNNSWPFKFRNEFGRVFRFQYLSELEY